MSGYDVFADGTYDYEEELLAELEATSNDELAGRVLPGTYASALDDLGMSDYDAPRARGASGASARASGDNQGSHRRQDPRLLSSAHGAGASGGALDYSDQQQRSEIVRDLLYELDGGRRRALGGGTVVAHSPPAGGADETIRRLRAEIADSRRGIAAYSDASEVGARGGAAASSNAVREWRVARALKAEAAAGAQVGGARALAEATNEASTLRETLLLERRDHRAAKLELAVSQRRLAQALDGAVDSRERGLAGGRAARSPRLIEALALLRVEGEHEMVPAITKLIKVRAPRATPRAAHHAAPRRAPRRRAPRRRASRRRSHRAHRGPCRSARPHSIPLPRPPPAPSPLA
jgi:hypothetical protein